ncbi:acetoacetate--CoA ligase [Auritidibacter sp. NML120636]|uniref:acetoacetate--CoA ligase n=1 Tax=Auritidibacter sp. NML120636 TaxID=2170743 RepID=UPI000D73E219|nr:acetoacetate--CoA ligase [Auritidibacter sp. NML120636]PXA79253.1 acetoacetate--CoA ligase [Auritidibacter sp. NML120636]
MASTAETTHPVLWQPTAEHTAHHPMTRFARRIEDKYGVTLANYADLHRWSVDHLADFWREVWDFSDVIASAGSETVYEGEEMQHTRWFPDARLNFAENMLRHVATHPEAEAIIGEHELSGTETLTWQQFHDQVAALAHYLRAVGVQPGDAVSAVLPNLPQTIVAMLATASVGAIWSVVNTDFSAHGVADRFAQIEPKVLITAEGFEFNGTYRDLRPTIPALLEVLPTVEHHLLIDRYCADEHLTAAGVELGDELPDLGSITSTRYSQVIAETHEAVYEQVPFGHPLWVLYSSGTTGKPKGIVHSHGGMTIEFYKLGGIHAGLGPDDRSYYAVATTWMVWNLLLAMLMSGATIITYDGSPTAGGPAKTFEILAKHRVTFFGTGAALLSLAERAGIFPNRQMDLSSIKTMMVTGSPLPDTTWEWVYQAINPDLRLGSDSGGTDMCSAFVGTNPYRPVRRGVLMGAYLGVDARVVNPQGQRVFDEVGELVVAQPMPSMPIYFWNDPDGQRYHSAYFDVFDGLWRHGDWATELSGGETLSATGETAGNGFIIHGRSDSTINRGGIRMGSADITQVVDGVDGVAASMVIGAELSGGDYYMPLFVVPIPGTSVTEELKQDIVTAIRTRISPRYVPDEIIEAPAVPTTKTGKLLEVPVKRLFQGASPDTVNKATASDADTLEWYIKKAEDFVAQRP